MPAEATPPMRLSELVLCVRHELQEVVEYLSLPQTRAVTGDAPGSAFVIPNEIRMRMPVVLEPWALTLPKAKFEKMVIPLRPFVRSAAVDANLQAESLPLLQVNVRMPSGKEATRPPVVGELEIEFLIAVK